ncbi:DUF6113 family protein [Streptomyces sp. NRRL S-87]|uniref:DUF6113 family protein n=1 Tax=Streptomyces sp. NRRL S-87 TaxID=1463920 RepID=UPI0004C16355|nr:DUF6113 family protein [Streptomyces sp. NRRL S-87]
MSGGGRARAGSGTAGSAGASGGPRAGGQGWAAPIGPLRILLALGLLVLGALVGIAGALVVEAWPPGGLVLALLASLGCFMGARIATGGALGVGAAATGWLIAFMWLSAPRAEGDTVFVAGISTYVYMVGGIVAAVICATLRGTVHRRV